MATAHNIGDHKAITCDCGSVNFALLMSNGIECNQCGKRHPFEWREYDAHECPTCGGHGKHEEHTHVDRSGCALTSMVHCDTCEGVGWCGPDAEKRAALMSAAQGAKP